jgi:GDP-4-dehydro-6-deoxy-D-mannose reductase
MKILLTGAAGFVGRALAVKLASRFPHAQMLGVSRETQNESKTLKYISINLAKTNLTPLLQEFKPSVIIHLAAHSSVGQANAQAAFTFEENMLSCYNLAKAMQASSHKIHLIFASSSEVYGGSFNLQNPVFETTPPAPLNPYARSKLAGEFLFRDMIGTQHPLTILRLFNHFGVGQDERFVIPSFAKQLKRIALGEQEPLIHVGNLEAIRDFLPLEDVLEAYCTAIEQEITGLYNICSSHGRPISRILEDLITLSGQKVTIQQDPARLRPSDIPSAIGQNSTFRNKSDWQPKKEWLEALSEVYACA